MIGIHPYAGELIDIVFRHKVEAGFKSQNEDRYLGNYEVRSSSQMPPPFL